MNAPTSSSAGAEKLLSSVEAEISRLVEQKTRNPPTQIEADPERIKAAIARLTFKFDRRARRNSCPNSSNFKHS